MPEQRRQAGDNSLWLAGLELYGRSAAATVDGGGGGGGGGTAAPAITDVVPVDAAGAGSDPPIILSNESDRPDAAAVRAGGGSGLRVAATVTIAPGTEVAGMAGWQPRCWAAVRVALLSAALWQAGPVMDSAAAASVRLGQHADTIGQWMAGRCGKIRSWLMPPHAPAQQE